MVVRHIVIISRPWRPFTRDVLKASSAFTGGTKSLMLRFVTEPLTLTRLNSICRPTDFLIAYSTENYSMGAVAWRPKIALMDHICRILNKCNISIADQKQLSTDRDSWKSICASDLSTYNVVSDQAAEDRRARRHNISTQPTNYWS